MTMIPPSVPTLAARVLSAVDACPPLTTPPQFVDMPEMATVSEGLDPREAVGLWAGGVANVVMDRAADLKDPVARASIENAYICTALDFASKGKPLEVKAVTLAAHALWLTLYGKAGEA